MNSRIRITGTGETPDRFDSAERISQLIEIAFQDSAWIHQCDGSVCVSHFLSPPERVLIKGTFSGSVDGEEISIPFERDYIISDNLSASAWLASPIVALLVAAFRAFYNERDPIKKAEGWITRSEFGIASEIEAKVSKIVGAPVQGIRLVWRNSLIAGGTMFLLAAASVTACCCIYPRARDLNDGLLGRFVISLMGGVVFGGFPAGLAGVFLGLTLAGREIEDSVAGQSLLRLVGVRHAKGLRIVSIVGATVCLGIVAAVVHMTISRK